LSPACIFARQILSGYLLNREYAAVLAHPFDLYHWLQQQSEDEVAYFLNEAGSNVLNYAEFGIPHKLELWLGPKGFIIGIGQQGKGFNPRQILDEAHKTNEGAAFEFYKNCHSAIFFDDREDAHAVYMLCAVTPPSSP
jgi:hypothetical protein